MSDLTDSPSVGAAPRSRVGTFYVFDIDGTLCDWKTHEALPNVRDWFSSDKECAGIAFATNQGGVGLRLMMESEGWGEPEKYPTAQDSQAAISEKLINATGSADWSIYKCYAYKTKNGNWSPVPEGSGKEFSPEWRKPNPGMLLHIVEDFNLDKSQVVFVGDWESDQNAAEAAGVSFEWANDFFKWEGTYE